MLGVLHYNFCRVHQTLGTTPAVAAGVTDHVWKLFEIIDLLEQAEAGMPRKRGPYKKRIAAELRSPGAAGTVGHPVRRTRFAAAASPRTARADGLR